jgi:hypothetical protein
MIDGFADLYRLAPMGFAPDTPPVDLDNLPGFAQDAENLAGDWRRVGDYLQNAMDAAHARINPSAS